MALSSEVDAKLPEAEAPEEMKLPSMEPVPAPGGAPGLFGLLSRPDFALKLGGATFLLGALLVLLTPAAFPPRVERLPPPLPARAPARRPRHLPATPLPRWMTAGSSAFSHRPSAVSRPRGKSSTAAAPRAKRATRPKPIAVGRRPMARFSPLRFHDFAGATCTVAADGVVMAGRRVPSAWAHEVRGLFAPPAEVEPAGPSAPPTLRLLEPNPGDAVVVDPPSRFCWSAVPGVRRYELSVEALTDPVEQSWNPVQDLFMLEVTGTQFKVPAKLHWAPGAVYCWRVQTGDGAVEAAGRFRVLSAAQRAHLEAARRTAGQSHLLRAAIDRSFGLYGASLTELQALRSLQPHQPALRWAVLNLEADIRQQRARATQ